MVDRLGGFLLTELRRVASYATLTVLALVALIRRPGEGARVVRAQTSRQVVFTAYEAIPLVGFIAAMVAVVLVAMAATFTAGITAPDLIRQVLTHVLVRELAPMMTALIVILRSCAAVTVELGYMSARGETEAAEALGIDPAKFLLLPRFVGITSAVIGLMMVFVAVAFVTGLGAAMLVESAPSLEVMAANVISDLTPTDFLVAFAKCFMFGVVIAAVACYHGLSVGRDITEIPRRTSRALVEALIHCTLIGVSVTLITL